MSNNKDIKPEAVDLKMTDIEGLQRAYASDKGVYVFGDRMYIAGTRSLNDAAGDFF